MSEEYVCCDFSIDSLSPHFGAGKKNLSRIMNHGNDDTALPCVEEVASTIKIESKSMVQQHLNEIVFLSINEVSSECAQMEAHGD